ncbi:zinc ABC transporter substrate-binding protein [Fertoebacter nigrum]|uniref:High-affinity zinc uptake system protein ZnuA n=1 Tax=Fertoeibacter niger TaxID=2656921 RepID=A0A8X8GUL0_9RHOB|nr:zinc ABC transporter substrate-binding protein [Fertoeibacter niger]NUB44634.1 zinc ABC transporter substrate-binding protein [Fertoeibacter niger]
MRYTISLRRASLPMATLLATAAPALADVPRVVTDMPPVHALVAGVMGDLGQPELLLDRGANAHAFQLRPSQAQALADAGLVVWIGPEMTPWLDRAVDSLGSGIPQLRLLAVPGTLTLAYGEDEHDHGAEAGHDDHGTDDHAAGEAHGHEHAEAAEEADAHEGHAHDAEEHEDHAENGDHAGHDDHAEGEHAGHDDHDHEEHAEGDDHAEGDHAGHDGHSHDGTDPHAWLDPANAAVWMQAIAVELGRLDPENAATYAANAATEATKLQALDAEVAGILAPAQGKPFVVFHDAYRYFTGHYGLTVAGSVALGDAASPGAARLAELRGTMQDGGALCIFPEAQHDPKLVAQMAEATGARLGGTLDPEGSQMEPGAGLYAALLRDLATTITDCVTKG